MLVPKESFSFYNCVHRSYIPQASKTFFSELLFFYTMHLFSLFPLFPMKKIVFSSVFAIAFASILSFANAAFPDTTGHKYETGINYVQAEGIVNGYPDGTYKPDLTISRAEFTKIVLEAAGTDLNVDCGNTPLEDTPTDQWHFPYVRSARCHGIVNGYPDGMFRPAGSINYAEAAKIVVNALELAVNDLQEGQEWWEPFVNAIIAVKAEPYEEMVSFHLMTRGEMAHVVYKVMTHEDEMTEGEENDEEEANNEEEMTDEEKMKMEMDALSQEEFEKADEEDTGGETVKKGPLQNGEYEAEGFAFVKEGNAGYMLRLEDFTVEPGPALRVYLATDTTASDFIDLGELKAYGGNLSYDNIPADTDLETYSHVLIWCEPYSVLFAYAQLEG